jgi:hypothetical protein
MEKEKLSISIKLKRPAEEEKENNVPLKKIKLNISSQKEFSLEEFIEKLKKEFPQAQLSQAKSLKDIKKSFKTLDKESELQEFTRKNVPKASEEKVVKLFQGIVTRDVKSVEKILKSFPLVIEHMNICTLFGQKFTWNCLHAACYYGLEKITKLILELGGDVEVKDTLNQARPLGWAAYGGHAELCKLLVSEYNADPWAKNIYGQNAFSLVADQSHPRWAGIWSKKDERKEKKRVLLTIPTVQKKEEEEELFVTVQPRKNQISKSEATPIPSPRVPPRQQAPVFSAYPISYGEFSLELIPLIKSLGIVSDDERIKMVYQVEPTFFGTVLTVPAKVQSLSLRLNLISLPDHKLYSSGYLYTSRLDIVKFKGSKSGAFQDTQLNLSEGVNVFEIRIVGGVVDDSEIGKARTYLEFLPGTEKGQSFLLIVNRS